MRDKQDDGRNRLRSDPLSKIVYLTLTVQDPALDEERAKNRSDTRQILAPRYLPGIALTCRMWMGLSRGRV